MEEDAPSAPASALQSLLERAAAASGDAQVSLYEEAVASSTATYSASEEQEAATSILGLAKALAARAKPSDGEALAALLPALRPWFSQAAKAKTAKLVRAIVEALSRVPGCEVLQERVLGDAVAWARTEKRNFLRLRLELRLAALLLSAGKLPAALAMVTGLVREVKKLDDKQLLVEIHLLESRALHATRNVPKARAALTASRTAANSIYVGPELQAEIDLQAGTLHAEERDFRTAFSYFFEAFEGLSSLGDARAATPLTYMLLCKIMTGATDDVSLLIASKAGSRYAGRAVDGMRAIASAHKARSLHAFERALADFHAETVADPLIARHLRDLADTLFGQNLQRLVEPFSCVEIAHLAELIALPLERVEAKLSQMILDGKISGTLDQGRGLVLLFDRVPEDKTCAAALKTIKNLGAVVDVLERRALALK